jgi:hypothetical protein
MLTQATKTALSEYVERQAAFGQLLVDIIQSNDPALATAANEVTAKANAATDAILSEPVDD